MPSDFPRRLLEIDGVIESPSMFSDRRALWMNGTEIAHEDTDGRYDVRLTRQRIRQMRDRLEGEPCVQLRASSSSDWVVIEVDDAGDAELLVELVTAAANAHRPPPGTALRPPPHGGELARRWRFH